MTTTGCMHPDCPAPAFVGRFPARAHERDPREHVEMPDGSTYHFACYWKAVRATSAVLPSITAQARAVRDGVSE